MDSPYSFEDLRRVVKYVVYANPLLRTEFYRNRDAESLYSQLCDCFSEVSIGRLVAFTNGGLSEVIEVTPQSWPLMIRPGTRISVNAQELSLDLEVLKLFPFFASVDEKDFSRPYGQSRHMMSYYDIGCLAEKAHHIFSPMKS